MIIAALAVEFLLGVGVGWAIFYARALSAKLKAANSYIENGDGFRDAVKLACDDRLQNYKHAARTAEAEAAALRRELDDARNRAGPEQG